MLATSVLTAVASRLDKAAAAVVVPPKPQGVERAAPPWTPPEQQDPWSRACNERGRLAAIAATVRELGLDSQATGLEPHHEEAYVDSAVIYVDAAATDATAAASDTADAAAYAAACVADAAAAAASAAYTKIAKIWPYWVSRYVAPRHVLRQSARWEIFLHAPENPWAPLVETMRLGCMPIGYVGTEFVIYAPGTP